MKKVGLFSLLAVSACALAGCGKGLTVEEACKFVEENFKHEGDGKKECTIKSVYKIKKATGIFEIIGEYAKDDERKISTYPVSKEAVAEYGVMGYEFSTFAGKLYADIKYDSVKALELLDAMYELDLVISKDNAKGEGSGSIVWNKEGYITSESSDFEVEFSYKSLTGKEQTAEFVATYEASYHY